MGGKVISNLEQLAEGIGSYMGMMDGLDQQTYMNEMLENIHARVSQEFNKHVVGVAMGDKESLRHMWEWGTAGINDNRGPTRYVDATSQRARLWTNLMVGQGRTKTITYAFLPSKGRVPPHDPAELGIKESDMPPLKLQTGLRRYKFAAKASVFESGITINIAPKKSKMLFIPIKTEGMPSGAKGDDSKGYVWAKSHTYSPGRMADAAGRFTGVFGGWWASQGNAMLATAMMEQVEGDIAKVSTGIRPNKRMTLAQASSIKAATERGRRKTRKQWTIKTRHDNEGSMEVIL